MYFVSGFVSVLLGLFMLFSLRVLAVAFPHYITDADGNDGASVYFQSSILFYPVLLLILGVIMIIVHLRTNDKD
ncbi:hypothetical protein P9D47_21540 [Bacillus haynesii]|uniref:hypothetical protein n=1 Tax=Bacillus haynesii TaxID=1925021 RepID=UPI001593344F|nr:hypothetical protein [Bacillus haynesii]NVB33211.1 hypothetical protein [Bacillus licheniformis]MCY7779652.1 hypothetical protein [Bacillus haynesii]MEC0668562.1 hypothetical protein [Bacillus haynesii]MEC1420487.1 hypothetical protein [Bacillus haynesii]MEC1470600.1 hypothetical protein [Bacillus haynesii]